MKIIHIKQTIISVLIGLLAVNLFISYGIWENRPKLNDLNFPKNQNPIINQTLDSNRSAQMQTDEDFEYKIIGYRASSGNRSSVIVMKNNKEYVVQEGEILDNQYTLKTVNKDKITFTSSGRVFEIKNTVGERLAASKK